MESAEIRKRFLDFFKARGHAIIPSAPLVPENDPSVLFNTAGMQPLAPYLLGQKHPMGSRLADAQKCVRTGDIDEVGDNRHLTFFEMLGNWSLGDYFKEESIKWSYEFLTSAEEGLGLDPSRIYVTVFAGDENAPRDTEALEIWNKYMPENRIYFLPAKNNWWSPGDNGPSGPDTEIFYDTNKTPLGDMTHDEFVAADEEGRVIEVWNNVFMEYEKQSGKVIGKLAQKNVDTGMGLERITMVCQKVSNVFETDLFGPILGKIDEFTTSLDIRAQYIVADHMRTAVFLIADGVIPSTTERGYVLRRLIRRAVRFADVLGMKHGSLEHIAGAVIEKYKDIYSVVSESSSAIKSEIEKEESKFRQTLEHGLKEFEKGVDPFILATTYGFPIELTEELAKEKNMTIDRAAFDIKMKEHQTLSRTASAGMFKGGLANHNEKTVRLHTAHHLLLAALQKVLGHEVKQRGSNITEERLRIDFAYDRKMTDEEKKRVEDIVNKNIQARLAVVRREMPREEAMKIGAEMEFGAKYPDVVSVYFIGPSSNTPQDDTHPVSIEFCGGPHVGNTSELGTFKIQKEEASSQGVRRIKAILE